MADQTDSTLSWGRQPPAAKPPRFPWLTRRLVVVFAVTVVVVAAIGVTRPGDVGDPARAAIAALMQQRHDALVKRDLDAYLATIDPARVPLRVCEQQRFEAAVRNKLPAADLTLGRTDVYAGYVRAWAHDLTGWRRIFVRNDSGHWYVSEPVGSETGADQSREFSGITVVASAADSDLIDPLGHDLGPVRDAVIRNSPTPPAKLFTVRIETVTISTGQCFIAGDARPTFDGTTLRMRSVTLATGYASLSTDSIDTLMHEALHWIQFEHSIDAVKAMDWWLLEGWPYRLSTDPSGRARTAAVCSGPLPSYDEIRRFPLPAVPPEELTRRYVIGAMLIERLEVLYGPDAYWRLVDAFAKEIESTRAFWAAFTTDGVTFYGAWADESRAHYC